MKKQIVIILALFLGTQSCNVGTYGSWINENIDSSIRNEIKELDDHLIQSVAENNSQALKKIMSDLLLEKSGNEIDGIVNHMNKFIDNTEYRILDQYYVKSTSKGISNTVMSGVSGENDYIIHYKAENEEMFISLLIIENGLDELLITAIYGKYPEGWKINIIQFGQIRINGMIATELYTEAKEQYEKGYLVDAANNMYLSSLVAKPANAFWQYQTENKMKEFFDEVVAEANKQYNFPLTLNNIDTKPQIISIAPQGMNEGYFPMVNYLTELDLKDTLSLKIENDKVHEKIGEVFNGLDKDKKYIFYKAWNEIPDGKTPKPNYGFIKELN